MRTAKYLSVAKINVTERFHHLSNLAGRALVVIVRIWIFTTLYTVTYRTAHATTINGIDVAGVVWMLVFTQAFRQSGWPVVAALVEADVKSGTLAYSINRPYSYQAFHFWSYVGRVLPNLLVNLGAAMIASLIFVGPLHLTIESALAGSLLLAMSYILDFFFSFAIGILAMWTEDTSAFQWIYFKGQLIFGGLILPLALFPGPLRSVAEWMPFPAMYYSASRLLVQFDLGLFEHYLLAQLLWMLIASGIAMTLFRRGIRKVEMNGG
ncbi:MAG: hypothetical protein Q8922_01040 [Bacteroidota bacterium]|nr:hypothetical protein [Bacteroidota bacterium]MDP4232186.1 hypothetical protein [Bacteroidota bacterium]MDP4241106.1 hypothetical protein [Bacteroidota bacterium]MDP4286498.1 hypothetical protein [Bacteroidota bacterium]